MFLLKYVLSFKFFSEYFYILFDNRLCMDSLLDEYDELFLFSFLFGTYFKYTVTFQSNTQIFLISGLFKEVSLILVNKYLNVLPNQSKDSLVAFLRSVK